MTARTDTFRGPAPAGPPGLADAGLVLEPDLDGRGFGLVGGDLGDQRREPLLRASWALGSACGCTGRVFLPGQAEVVQ